MRGGLTPAGWPYRTYCTRSLQAFVCAKPNAQKRTPRSMGARFCVLSTPLTKKTYRLEGFFRGGVAKLTQTCLDFRTIEKLFSATAELTQQRESKF